MCASTSPLGAGHSQNKEKAEVVPNIKSHHKYRLLRKEAASRFAGTEYQNIVQPGARYLGPWLTHHNSCAVEIQKRTVENQKGSLEKQQEAMENRKGICRTFIRRALESQKGRCGKTER